MLITGGAEPGRPPHRPRRARLWAPASGSAIFKVILPNIKFGVLTAAFLAFVLSWEEIGVTLFITSVNAVTLPRMMWMGLRDNIDPAIAAISVMLIIIVIAVILGKTAIRLSMGEQEVKKPLAQIRRTNYTIVAIKNLTEERML